MMKLSNIVGVDAGGPPAPSSQRRIGFGHPLTLRQSRPRLPPR